MSQEVESQVLIGVASNGQSAQEQLQRLRLYDIMQLGYDLYGSARASSSREEGGTQSVIKKYETRSCAALMEYLESFPLSTTAGLYALRLRQIATSFANNMGSARRTLVSKREFAHEVRQQSQEREAVVVGWEAVARLAFQLFIIGGITGIVSHLVLRNLGIAQTEAGGPGSVQILMSIAIAMGSMLFGMAKQLRDISRAQNQIDARYYADLDHAKEKQSDRMKAALDRAQVGFTDAYREYFGVEPDEATASVGLEHGIIDSLRAQNDPPCSVREQLGIFGVLRAMRDTVLRRNRCAKV